MAETNRRIEEMKRKNVKSKEPSSGTKRHVRMAFTAFSMVVLMCSFAVPAMADGAETNPINVVNNLSNFIFGLIRAVGIILLGWGIVQVGMSFQSHDPSQRSNGFLTLAGGVVITFAKEILNLIIGA